MFWTRSPGSVAEISCWQSVLEIVCPQEWDKRLWPLTVAAAEAYKTQQHANTEASWLRPGGVCEWFCQVLFLSCAAGRKLFSSGMNCSCAALYLGNGRRSYHWEICLINWICLRNPLLLFPMPPLQKKSLLHSVRFFFPKLHHVPLVYSNQDIRTFTNPYVLAP